MNEYVSGPSVFSSLSGFESPFQQQLDLALHPPTSISDGCVSTELETLPQVELKGDLCVDLPSKTECFGIENGNLREGCPLSN